MGLIHGQAGRLVSLDPPRPDRPRFRLVILADGFDPASLPVFADACLAVREELHSTAPFSLLQGVLEVARLDRTDGPQVVTVTDGRLLRVDEDAAREIAEGVGVRAHALLVIANTRVYAGFGGTGVAAVTLHEQGPRLALHELGHAAFDLADEYGSDGPAASGPGEPRRVNISLVSDPSAVKWADLASMDGSVGCFEGGDRAADGIYRPSLRCIMRSVHDPFCPVCRREISRQLVSAARGAPPMCSDLRVWDSHHPTPPTGNRPRSLP